MANISKLFKCVACSTDFSFNLSTDLEINDITVIGKCPKCGASVQISLGIFGQPPQPSQPVEPSANESASAPSEMSEEIKQLIEG